MLQSFVIVPVALAYIGILFAIARYGDKRADEGRSIIANPYIYALSLGVYATAWTFYGSVGRAAGDGVGFLPIYIGPTLMMALWWLVMRKIVRISKANRITSLADFISSRYGKSALIAGLVTIIAVIGVLPYIALQLKAVSHSFTILARYPKIAMSGLAGGGADRRGHGVLDGAPARDLHDPVRHAAPRRFRAPRGPRGGDRVRVADETGRVRRRRRLRDLGHLRRARRHLRAGRRASASRDALRAAGRGRGKLRELGVAHRAVDARDHVPAAAVPGRRGRERQREPSRQGHLALPALHARDERLRRAGGVRRRPSFLGDRGRSRHVRADAADGAEAGGDRAARLHRRVVGGDRHGDRRDDRAVDDGLQRPRDAGPAADALDAARRAPEPDRDCCSGSAAARSSRSSCSAISISGSRARPTRWSRSGSFPSPRSRSSRRPPSAASTGRARRAPARSPASAPDSALWPTRCCCRHSPSRDGCRRASCRTGRSASRS